MPRNPSRPRNRSNRRLRLQTATNSRMEPQYDRFNSRTYKFQQTLGETTAAQTATTPVLKGGTSFTVLSPTFNMLDQYLSLTALFDQYRIARVDWAFRPSFSGLNFSTTDNVPIIYTVYDYADNANPVTLAELREYQDCQAHQYESFKASCVPHCANAMYAGAFTSYGNLTSPWLDTNSPGVVHYGLKFGITAGAGGQVNLQRWWITVTLTVEMRNVR